MVVQVAAWKTSKTHHRDAKKLSWSSCFRLQCRDEEFARSQARSASDRILARIYCLVNHLVAANLLQGEPNWRRALRNSSFSSFFHPGPPPAPSLFPVSFPFARKHSLFQFDSADLPLQSKLRPNSPFSKNIVSLFYVFYKFRQTISIGFYKFRQIERQWNYLKTSNIKMIKTENMHKIFIKRKTEKEREEIYQSYCDTSSSAK